MVISNVLSMENTPHPQFCHIRSFAANNLYTSYTPPPHFLADREELRRG